MNTKKRTNHPNSRVKYMFISFLSMWLLHIHATLFCPRCARWKCGKYGNKETESKKTYTNARVLPFEDALNGKKPIVIRTCALVTIAQVQYNRRFIDIQVSLCWYLSMKITCVICRKHIDICSIHPFLCP